jgi:hypothetical protein
MPNNNVRLANRYLGYGVVHQYGTRNIGMVPEKNYAFVWHLPAQYG